MSKRITPIVVFVVWLLALGGPGQAWAQACFWTDSFSEENPPSICPAGHAVKGIRCDGRNCDRKRLQCCRYMSGFDRTASYRWSQWVSEERPGREVSRDEFVSGLACQGRYCDNLRIRYVRSERLQNSERCRRTAAFSSGAEEVCKAGEFVAGLECRGSYCAELRLYCCAER